MASEQLASGLRQELLSYARQSGRGDHTVGRIVDVVVSLLILLAVAPLMLLIALVIMMSDGGPPVFAHRRIGRDGASFSCFKFRSMVLDSRERLERLLATDPRARLEWERDQKLRNDPRITWLGYYLRKTSLDELPQLFNVLIGDMSLVGPRPIVAAEVPRYGRYFRHYCAQRPGITGLWQISGRNDTTYRRRVALDVAYSRAACVGFDLRILFLTVPAILLSRGTY